MFGEMDDQVVVAGSQQRQEMPFPCAGGRTNEILPITVDAMHPGNRRMEGEHGRGVGVNQGVDAQVGAWRFNTEKPAMPAERRRGGAT